jgi:hypothetical protein
MYYIRPNLTNIIPKIQAKNSLILKSIEKKTKLLASPNIFSVLVKCDDIDVNKFTINVQTCNSDDKLKVPPVYTKNVYNIFTFISNLMTILDYRFHL